MPLEIYTRTGNVKGTQNAVYTHTHSGSFAEGRDSADAEGYTGVDSAEKGMRRRGKNKKDRDNDRDIMKHRIQAACPAHHPVFLVLPTSHSVTVSSLGLRSRKL